MPDSMDLAAELSQTWLDKCIRETRMEGPGALLCVDCEEEIPELRRQTLPSATRCVPCQARLEERLATLRPSWGGAC